MLREGMFELPTYFLLLVGVSLALGIWALIKRKAAPSYALAGFCTLPAWIGLYSLTQEDPVMSQHVAPYWIAFGVMPFVVLFLGYFLEKFWPQSSMKRVTINLILTIVAVIFLVAWDSIKPEVSLNMGLGYENDLYLTREHDGSVLAGVIAVISLIALQSFFIGREAQRLKSQKYKPPID